MRKTRVITHLRVSALSQSDDGRYGFKRQDRIARQSEIKHNLERVALVTDVISGASELQSREGLNSIPQKALELEATGVNLSELDRLTRADPIGAYELLKTLLDFGLDIYSNDLRSRVNRNDPESVREVNDRLRQAYEERVRIRERTYGGLLAKAADGKPPRPINRYGFINSEFVEHEAVWVRYVHEQSLTYGSRRIAEILEAQGVPTRSGKPWDKYMVDQLLFDPVYIGQYQYGREGVCTNPHCRERRLGSYRNKVKGVMLCKRCGSEMALNTQTVHIPAMINPSLRAASTQAIERRKSNHGKTGRRPWAQLQGRILCGTCLDEGRSGTMSAQQLRNPHKPKRTKNDYQDQLRAWLERTLTNGYKGTQAAREMGLNQPKEAAFRFRQKLRDVIEAHRQGKLSTEDALKHVPRHEGSPLLYYFCRSAIEKPKTCSNFKMVPALDLHEAVREALEHIFDDEEKLKGALELEPEEPKIDHTRELARLKTQLERAQTAYLEGLFDTLELQKRSRPLKEKIHALEQEMNKPRLEPRDVRAFRSDVLEALEKDSLRDVMAKANCVVILDREMNFRLEFR
jgi:DNA invertase Pin-like site-specific DNA recombinase